MPTCAGQLRERLHQGVQNAGLTAATIALSGLCLVGSMTFTYSTAASVLMQLYGARNSIKS